MENSRRGYFDDNGDFFTLDNIKVDIPKNKEIQLYITDKPVNADAMKQSKAARQMRALDRFLREDDEPLPDGFEEFINNNRIHTTREIDL